MPRFGYISPLSNSQLSDSGDPALTREPQNEPDDQEDDDDDDYSTGKALCAFGVIICGLLMFTLPVSKFILAADMLTHFALHYMVAGGALLVGFFLPRWNVRFAVVLTIIGVFLIGFTATHKPEPTEQALADGEKRLKLMTFNTWRRNHDWKSIEKEIRKTDPDIVTLLEFGSEKARLLTSLKRQYPYQLSCLHIHSCHMAILSKHPFLKKQIRTRWRGPPYVMATFGKKLAGLTVFAVHTIRPPHYKAHYRQIGSLSGVVNQVRGLKIVMGDFNSTPFSRTLNTFAKRTRLKRLTDTPSWPAQYGGLPQVAIDHIFVSPKIRQVREHRLGGNAGSDHFPVNTVVAIPTS